MQPMMSDEPVPKVVAEMVIGLLLAALIIAVGLLFAPLGKYRVR